MSDIMKLKHQNNNIIITESIYFWCTRELGLQNIMRLPQNIGDRIIFNYHRYNVVLCRILIFILAPIPCTLFAVRTCMRAMVVRKPTGRKTRLLIKV